MSKYPIPYAALDDRLAWTGTSGTGKTYDAGTAIEKVLHAKSRACILDPLGVWWGLRLRDDGKGTGFKVAIFGGPHGDIAITETSGKLIGETVATTTESCIVDLSEFDTEASQRRFMLAFLVALYGGLKGDLLHLVLDEADMWAPQRIMDKEGDATKLHHNVQKIVRRGRVKGFIPWLITQRPAELSKSVLSQVDGIVAHQLVAPQDVKALMDWVSGHADKETLELIKTGLPSFNRGEAAVYIPRRGVLTIAQFPKKVTFDSSRSPERGEKKNRPDIALKPLDIEALKKRLEKVEAEAKANDPNALKAEIAELKREKAALERAKPAPPDPAAVTKAKEKAAEAVATARAASANAAILQKVVEAAMKFIIEINAEGFFKAGGETVNQAAIEKVIKDATAAATKLIEKNMETRSRQVDAARLEAGRVLARMKALIESLDKDVTVSVAVSHNEPFTIKSGSPAGSGTRPTPQRAARGPNNGARTSSPALAGGDGTISPVQQRILDAVAEMEALCRKAPPRTLVAIFAGYKHPRSKGFVNALSGLSAAGHVAYPDPGTVGLTEQGQALAAPPAAVLTTADVQARAVALLGGVSGRVLSRLIEVYPEAIEREQLAADTGYGHVRSKGFVNTLSKLSSLGFITYPSTGQARAGDVLFP